MIDDSRIAAMADDLARVAGVAAVTLGGSRARGAHRPDSDVDLGVYYRADALDVAQLQALALHWSSEDAPLAAPGGWGPWVDGGAWLRVDGVAVDWILRDVDRVAEQCRRAHEGRFAFHPQPGHPLGFLDVAYAGEVARGVVLRDDRGVLAALRAQADPYPEALRHAVIETLWQVDFLLDTAVKGAGRADVAYVTLCMSHAALLIAHGWHALAGVWLLNEKGAVDEVARLPIETHGFAGVAADALASIGASSEELLAAVAALRAAPRPSV